MKLYMQKRRQDRRDRATTLLGGKCVKCGSIDQLEFDHIDPATKQYTISSPKLLDGPWSKLEEELGKCQLLCNRHHIEKTSKENSERIPWNKGIGGTLVHGTASMYSERKCKCDLCRLAKKLYRAKQVTYHQQVHSG